MESRLFKLKYLRATDVVGRRRLLVHRQVTMSLLHQAGHLQARRQVPMAIQRENKMVILSRISKNTGIAVFGLHILFLQCLPGRILSMPKK